MPTILDRDGLFFEYPRKAGETVKRIVFLPFSNVGSDPATSNAEYFTNITITDKKAAKLVSYNVINRNSTLFSHTGATSRMLTFKATINGETLNQEKSFKPSTPSNASSRSKFKFVTLPKTQRKGGPALYTPLTFVKDILTTCVTTHATNTVLGPPLIRLKYTQAFQQCLFVCNDVSLTNTIDRTGPTVNAENPRDRTARNFDKKVFKTFDLTMNLKEVRSNDGSLFVPNKLVQRDGVAGWEAVLDGLGYDPGSLED